MVALFSCSQDQDAVIDEKPETLKTQTLSIRVKEFGDQTVLTRSSEDIYTLKYLVYDKNTGDLVKIKLIDNSLSIKDTLAVGEYHVSVLALFKDARDQVVLRDKDLLKYDNAVIDVNSAESDLFYSSFDVNVGLDPVAKEISLHRIVGKVEVFIEDAHKLPSDINIVRISLSRNLPTYFRLKNEQTQCQDVSFLPVIDLKRTDFLAKEGVQFEMYFLANSPEYSINEEKSDLYISLMDSDQGIINKKDILIKTNLSVARNQTIKLSGKLFDQSVNENVVIEEAWEDVVEVGFN